MRNLGTEVFSHFNSYLQFETKMLRPQNSQNFHRKLKRKVKMKVGFISLGCSKNLIDTEVTIGLFKRANYEIVNDEKKAEILVINTCRIY